MPGLIGSTKPDGGRGNIDGTKAKDEPQGGQRSRSRQATFCRWVRRRNPTMDSRKMAESGFHRGASAFTIAGWCFPFNGLVEVPSEHDRPELEAQVPDEQQKRDAHRLPFRASVVDVDIRYGNVGARLVGCLAKFAGNCHTFNRRRRVTHANMEFETVYKKCRTRRCPC